jgi:hypothetical protein
VLITSVPIESADDAETVYTEWRYRPQVEHTYRFDQEDSLDIENMRVRTVERMRRVFALTLIATLFVYHIGHVWPYKAVLWLRRLGQVGFLNRPRWSLRAPGGTQRCLCHVSYSLLCCSAPVPGKGDTCG